MELESVSTYYLIIELLNNGSAGLLPEHEPIPVQAIVSELVQRSGTTYHEDQEVWARWFIASKEHGSEIERANTLIFMNTREMFRDLSRTLKK